MEARTEVIAPKIVGFILEVGLSVSPSKLGEDIDHSVGLIGVGHLCFSVGGVFAPSESLFEVLFEDVDVKHSMYFLSSFTVIIIAHPNGFVKGFRKIFLIIFSL